MDFGGGGRITQRSSAATAPDLGLEYHIKFPSSAFNYALGESLSLAVDTQRLPVILLFGWAGCQDKYLAKYSHIYEEKGLITLRYIVPIGNLLWQRAQIVHIARKLIKLLYDFNFERHPIVVHCFSNGGAFLYQNFSNALATQENTDIQIKGVIFDSGPARRRLRCLYRAVSAIMGGSFLYNFAASAVITCICFAMWMYELLQTYVLNDPHVVVADPFKQLLDEGFRWPQHFIYSESDDLVPYKDVDHFMEQRRKLGVVVTSKKYKSSAHVKHYFADKDGYEDSVYSFVSSCLRIDALET